MKPKRVKKIDIRKLPDKFANVTLQIKKEYLLRLDIANYIGVSDEQVLDYAVYQMKQRGYTLDQINVLYGTVLSILPALKCFDATYSITGPDQKLLTATYTVR